MSHVSSECGRSLNNGYVLCTGTLPCWVLSRVRQLLYVTAALALGQAYDALEVVQVDGQFVKLCKRLVLQFVILRPILAIITIALSARGYYKEGTWTTDSGCVSPAALATRYQCRAPGCLLACPVVRTATSPKPGVIPVLRTRLVRSIQKPACPCCVCSVVVD